MKSYPILISSIVLLSLSSAGLQANIAVDATTGFTGWTEQLTSGDGGQNGSFVASSGTAMDTGGNSWGLYANTSQTAARTYDFGSVLAVGETVTISVSLNSIDSGGTVGFRLQNSSGDNRFQTYYIGGDASDTFKLNDAGGPENITGPTTTFASSAGPNFQEISFTQLAGDGYSLSFGGVAVTNVALTLAASDISQIQIFNFNAGASNDQFFNSLDVVPEPSSYALLGGLFALAWVAFRRR